MPVSNFDGRTFVAFTDVSGFKEMMKDDQRAIRALEGRSMKGSAGARKSQQLLNPTKQDYSRMVGYSSLAELGKVCP